jgi:ADP-ribose pyrophosphatase YjhB (NUDIX family)
MNHRVRAAVLLVENEKILLVKHVHPLTGEAWWIPPGGGLAAGDESVIDCARREAYEETGLTVEVEKLVYLREFIDQPNATHHLELFFLGQVIGGELTIANIKGKGPDEDYIKAVAWLSKDELPRLVVFPEHLAQGFWRDLALGFPEVHHLGTQIDPT